MFMKSSTIMDSRMEWAFRSMVVILFTMLASAAGWSQCASFGAFDIGEDVEITCQDSCITLFSPSIANVAVGGSDYEVEEIDYELPYPFNQGNVAINTLTELSKVDEKLLNVL